MLCDIFLTLLCYMRALCWRGWSSFRLKPWAWLADRCPTKGKRMIHCTNTQTNARHLFQESYVVVLYTKNKTYIPRMFFSYVCVVQWYMETYLILNSSTRVFVNQASYRFIDAIIFTFSCQNPSAFSAKSSVRTAFCFFGDTVFRNQKMLLLISFPLFQKI